MMDVGGINHGFFALKDGEAPRKVIFAFRGEFNFLSNFSRCRVILPAEGDLPAMEFTSAENAYMAWKTTDLAVRRKIQAMAPGEAKVFTHQPGFPLRADYTDENRLKIMLELTRSKYGAENPDLRAKLLATGDALLIEGNDWGDVFFGLDLKEGHGANHLGRIIMRVRKEITGP